MKPPQTNVQISGRKVKIGVNIKGSGPTPANLRTYLTRRLKKCGMIYSPTNTWTTPDSVTPDQAREALQYALDVFENPQRSVGYKARWSATASQLSVKLEKS
jgi:hypothetical protein